MLEVKEGTRDTNKGKKGKDQRSEIGRCCHRLEKRRTGQLDVGVTTDIQYLKNRGAVKGEIGRDKRRRGCQNEVEMEEAGGGGMEGE